MTRVLSAALIGLFLIVIAAAVAFTLGRLTGADIGSTVAIGLGVLFALFIVHSGMQRLRDQTLIHRRLTDLDHSESALARPIQLLTKRIGELETALGQHPKTTDLEPILNEVEVLSALVRQLAESVAAVDARVDAVEQAQREAQAVVALPQQGERPAPEPAQADAGEPQRVQPRPATPDPGPSKERQEEILRAIDRGDIEIHLQPVVTLPQRKARYYEALARLRDDAGNLIMPGEFLPVATRAGAIGKLDNLMLFRSVQLLRSLAARQAQTGLFVNLAAESLADNEFFGEFIAFMQANRTLADSMIFEFTQAGVTGMGPIELEGLSALRALGFRLSMDRISDMKMDYQTLAGRGFRFVKISAELLLRKPGLTVPDIAPADMSDMLARFGIDLIADRIETEAEVVDLLDFDIRLGQGNLFAPPRAVRAEVMGRVVAEETRRAVS